MAIKECNEEHGDPVEAACELLGVSRAAYYRWLSGKKCARELENENIAEIMEQIHTENPDKGYRRIKDDLVHDHKMNINEKTKQYLNLYLTNGWLTERKSEKKCFKIIH